MGLRRKIIIWLKAVDFDGTIAVYRDCQDDNEVYNVVTSLYALLRSGVATEFQVCQATGENWLDFTKFLETVPSEGN